MTMRATKNEANIKKTNVHRKITTTLFSCKRSTQRKFLLAMHNKIKMESNFQRLINIFGKLSVKRINNGNKKTEILFRDKIN